MKRGLIAWDRRELPPEALESRLAVVRKSLAERDLPALVIYTDVWRSNQGRHFSNFMPYWNRALIVLPRDGAPVLLCALSPRVYPWIRSVTILDEIRPSSNLTQKLLEMSRENGWRRIGVLDLARLTEDLFAAIQAAEIEAVDVPSSAVWPSLDDWELAMHRRGTQLARSVLADEFSKAAGCTDYEFAGRLERKFRLEGAEDVVLLFTDGQTAPRPACGALIKETSSVGVALEYRGHWIKLSRPHPCSGVAAPLESLFRSSIRGLGADLNTPVYVEALSGPYPYESCDLSAIQPGTLFALHMESRSGQHRWFYGDTAWRAPGGGEVL